MRQIFELPAMRRTVELAPITANPQTRTVEVVWTTGASARRRHWTGFDTAIDYEEILVVSRDAVDLSRLDAGAPVLDSHSQWTTRAIVGVAERSWTEKGEGRASVRFPKPGVDEAADLLFALVTDGIVRNISVGDPHRQGACRTARTCRRARTLVRRTLDAARTFLRRGRR